MPRTITRGRANPVVDESVRARRTEPSARPSSTAVTEGWGAFDAAAASAGEYPDDFKPTSTPQIVKFLDAMPVRSWQEHWVNEIREGKRSFVCLGDDCPLCDIGDRPGPRAAFNVVEFSDPDEPSVQLWTVKSRAGKTIQALAGDKRTSPLTREDLYFAVSKTGTDTNTNTVLTPVKARDLQEDWDIVPLTAAELTELRTDVSDGAFLYVNTRSQLQDVVDRITHEA